MLQEFTLKEKKEVNNLNQMGWLARNGQSLNQEEVQTKMITHLNKLFLPHLKNIASKTPLCELHRAPQLPKVLENIDTRFELLETKLKKLEESQSNQGETEKLSPIRTPNQFRI